jgi:hypothetical protein
LFSNLQKIKQDDFKLQALLVGVDLDKETKKRPTKNSQTIQEDPDIPIFGDPEKYKEYSEEEKQKITDQMMQKHKSWAGTVLRK